MDDALKKIIDTQVMFGDALVMPKVKYDTDIREARQSTLDEVREMIKHIDSTKYSAVGVKYAILQALDTLSTQR